MSSDLGKKKKKKSKPRAHKNGGKGMGMCNEKARKKQRRSERWTIRNQALPAHLG